MEAEGVLTPAHDGVEVAKLAQSTRLTRAVSQVDVDAPSVQVRRLGLVVLLRMAVRLPMSYQALATSPARPAARRSGGPSR